MDERAKVRYVAGGGKVGIIDETIPKKEVSGELSNSCLDVFRGVQIRHNEGELGNDDRAFDRNWSSPKKGYTQENY